MKWCECRVMERKESTNLWNDDVFQKLICPNPVIFLNEDARNFPSAVSKAA